VDRDFPTLERWAFVLIAAAVFSNSTWAAGPTVAFDIPAGHAPQTLHQFYLQSRVRVLYLTENVKGVQTQAVGGEFEASDALAQMLQGTGLSYEFDGEYSAVVRSATNVAAVPQAATTSSSPGEGPNIPVPPAFDTRDQTKVEEVLVTGSLIHGVFDITSPLIPVDRKEMKRTAYATVQEALRALPMAATMTRGEVVGGVGNFNRGSGINLRGLGDSATLVLVNGRRQPPAGLSGDFVDVSNIPWSMVDRIEVLPDGGSALYGSDAVAGVVNILLREDMDGAETQLRYGTAADGAAELLAAQLVGHSWESGQWFAGYQYYERTSLAATDRDFAANADKGSLGGRDFRRVGSNPGNILDPQTLQPVFAIPRGQDGTSLSAGDLLPEVVNYRNQFADTQLLPDKHAHNLYFSGSQHLSEHLELFAEGRYAQRDIRATPFLSADAGPLLLVPATNPFFVDPFGGAPFVIVAYDFTNELGPMRDRGRTRNYVGTLGLKTEFNDAWQASLSASYGAEDLRWTDYGDVNLVALEAALADPDPATAFNPFGDGSHTNPATIEAVRSVVRRNARSEISSIQLTADGPLFDLPSGVLKMAIGTEYREESLDQESHLPGYELIPVPTRIQFGRKIAAAFAELSVPLIGNPADLHAPPRLELSLAGRYEQYDDFGRTYNPKIGLRWTPLASVKLRASWGTSFKAPNLVDLDDTRNVSGLVSLRDPRSPTGRSTVLGLQGGNPDLKEERAATWTAGLDLAPPALPGFRLSLTGYSTDYKDQVIQPGPLNLFDVLLEEDQWAAVITRNPSQLQIDAICASPQFLGNASDCRTNPPTVLFDFRKHNLAITQVRGLDLALNQSFDTDVGRFNVQVNGNHVFHFKRAFTKTAPAVDIVDTVNNPLAFRLRGTVEWQQRERGFSVNLTANYTGGYQDRDSPLRHSVDAWTTFDLGLRYQAEKRGGWMDDTEFALNVANVLNDDPPFVDREWGYDYFNAQPTGRVLSATVSRRW
jgi:iron complex outermembrane recepter protein